MEIEVATNNGRTGSCYSNYEVEDMLSVSFNKLFANDEARTKPACGFCCFCFHSARSSARCFKSMVHISLIFAIVSVLYVMAITLGLINYKRMTTLFLKDKMTSTCFNQTFKLATTCDRDRPDPRINLFACSVAVDATGCDQDLQKCINTHYRDKCRRFQRRLPDNTLLKRTGNCIYESLKISSVLKEDDNAFSGEFWEKFCGRDLDSLRKYLVERRDHFRARLLILLISIGVLCTSTFCAVSHALLQRLIIKYVYGKKRKTASVQPVYKILRGTEETQAPDPTVYVVPANQSTNRFKSAAGSSNRIFKLGQNLEQQIDPLLLHAWHFTTKP